MLCINRLLVCRAEFEDQVSKFLCFIVVHFFFFYWLTFYNFCFVGFQCLMASYITEKLMSVRIVMISTWQNVLKYDLKLTFENSLGVKLVNE